jgi:hypothetical protein
MHGYTNIKLVLFIHNSPVLYYQSLDKTDSTNELEILRQAMFAVYFTLKSHSLSGGTEENYEQNLVRIENRLAEIRARDIPTTNNRTNRSTYGITEVWKYLTTCSFIYRNHLFSKFSQKTPHMFSRLNLLPYDSRLQFCILPDARIKNKLHNSPVQCQYCQYALTIF